MLRFIKRKHEALVDISALIALILSFALTPYVLEKMNLLPNSWFNAQNMALNHPHVESLFPTWTFVPAAVIVFIIVIIVDWILFHSKRRLGVLFVSYLEAIAITNFITMLFKCTIGQLRPDFVYRCWGKEGPPAGTEWFWTADCPNPDKLVLQGKLSFPSGHSSTSFVLAVSFCTYLWYYAHTRLSISSKIFFGGLFIAYSAAVSGSRLWNDMHHPWDVTTGALIGSAVGLAFPLLVTDNFRIYCKAIDDDMTEYVAV